MRGKTGKARYELRELSTRGAKRAKRRAVQRAKGETVVGEAKGELEFPEKLSACPLVQALMSQECEEKVRQQAYEDITGTVAIPFRNERGQAIATLRYNVMDTVMTHLARRSKDACVGGRIELVLSGTPKSKKQQVLDEFTRLHIDLKRHCANKRTIYIPLSAVWVGNRAAPVLNVAKQQKSRRGLGATQKTRKVASRAAQIRGRGFSVCFHDVCKEGHGMAVIITAPNIIEYYEPNGKDVPWYPAVSEYLDGLFASLLLFRDYQVQENEKCPRYGMQAAVGLPLCAYFSTLYAAIRITCPALSADDVTDELQSLEPEAIQELVRLWNCFAFGFAEEIGALDAIPVVQKQFSEAVDRLTNMSGNAANRYWERLNDIQDLAITDLVAASEQLERFAAP